MSAPLAQLPVPAVPTATAATPGLTLTPAPERCENCGNAVEQRYCGACGQRLDAPVHSLWHFSALAAEDLTHADSRLWRTLGALLFKPGFLTREFLAGRRARYLPPVRLYLVLSLAFFLFAAVTHPKMEVVNFQTAHPGDSGLLVPKAGESDPQRADRLCQDWSYSGPWAQKLAPLLPQTCHKIILDGGRQLTAAFLHNVPRAMFVFLPLIAAIMMLMYWRPRHYYVEHLLLLVHNHAFVFLALMLAWSAGLVLGHLPGIVKFAIFLYFVWYMYRSMRVAYTQGRWLTGSKLVLLVAFYVLFGAITLTITSLYSAFTL
jgi:hypothetical protein